MKLKLLTLGISLFDKLPEMKFVGEDWALREWSWGIADELWNRKCKLVRFEREKALQKELV